jgi:hypothetical protein
MAQQPPPDFDTAWQKLVAYLHVHDLKISDIPEANRSCARLARACEYGQIVVQIRGFADAHHLNFAEKVAFSIKASHRPKEHIACTMSLDEILAELEMARDPGVAAGSQR